MTDNEMEVKFEEEPKSNFGKFLWILIFLIALILAIGFYLSNQPFGQETIVKIQNFFKEEKGGGEQLYVKVIEGTKDEEIKRLQFALMQKEQELINLTNSMNGSINVSFERGNTLTDIRYAIKPKNQIIAECFSMDVGKWKIPQGCLLSIATKVSQELEKDKQVVAFEVQGIVDTNPYRGLSPELKQEGLASFRAREAIREIYAKIPNATAFEGPSIQRPNQRGYSIKAYFVE
ncbi:hypothetical protein [Helicobacter mesocricetorum]|uniref:hypothetical protein n=1 Tax=Helicobacter mesocricetorum TaxID=87012 RepID=UPI001F22D5EC|nr:hypothetical protein [Helicobacter mesocricetorum]